MSTRTIIEINHDHLDLRTAALLVELIRGLGMSSIAGALNDGTGEPVNWGPGIRILAQRHHSETLKLEVK